MEINPIYSKGTKQNDIDDDDSKINNMFKKETFLQNKKSKNLLI